MLKSLQIPLRGLLAVAFLLTAVPVSHATYNPNVYDSVVKKLKKNPEDTGAEDIHDILLKALKSNPNEGEDLIKALIRYLKRHHGDFDDVSNNRLNRIRRELRNWVQKHRPENPGNSGGGVTPPESAH